MTKITMDGKYQTRDGRPVRVLCVDADIDGQPVVGIIGGKYGDEVQSWEADGSYWDDNDNDPDDLIPVPEKRRVKFWVNVYGDRNGNLWDCRSNADMAAGSGRLACLEIDREFTVGEGL